MTDPLGLDDVVVEATGEGSLPKEGETYEPAESGKAVVALEPRCGAKRRNTDPPEYCRNPAGFRTDHPGEGRCYFHGGVIGRQLIHGRYASVKSKSLRDLIGHYQEDPEILNAIPELALVRALLTDFLNRYDEFVAALLAWHESYIAEDNKNPKPLQILDLSDAVRHADTVSKMIERIEKVRNANAISRADLNRAFNAMTHVVAAEVTDQATRARIERGWRDVLSRI